MLNQREIPTPGDFGDARCTRFEFSSRGDRVPGRLILPSQGSEPFPLVLLQHGIGGSKDAPYMAAAARWVRAGAAVASIDFPLHGERASSKLTERIVAALVTEDGALPGDGADAVARDLWIESTRQAVCDLSRALDTLLALPQISEERVVYAGFSLGGIVGTLFCAADPRPRAAALALAGGGFGPPETDPCNHVSKIAPRPLLLVNATRDQRIPRAATEALYAAAGEPKQIDWFETSHGDLPGLALKTMWAFLSAQLGMAASGG